MNLWVIFITGLTLGSLTCLAVQGGLLASIITAREEGDLEEGRNKQSLPLRGKNHTVFPTLAFLTTKLISYTILGFILGAFGGVLNISPNIQIIMQFIAGLYMVAVALNLLNVHPIFRYAIIQPPRFLTRMVRNQSKSKDLFAPALLGAMTIFIPCGTTLAMETLAISSANAFLGASIMFVFILGTSPLFFGVGWLTTVLGDNFRERFLKIAAFAVLYLGITSINGALIAGGSSITLQTLTDAIPIEINLSGNGGEAQAAAPDTGVRTEGGVQTADIQVSGYGYTPNYIQVKAGTPVKLNLSNSGGLGCTSVFRVPQMGITKTLTLGGTDTVEFTPQNPGKLTFSCSMGMYRGTIEVI
ncbi:sulfite exporter TauE/SafE family protein [Candidatus Daviesbacteria bacterium]|nr:sulfite exporter TauE/SafE family protein [Candidatus Daviesbacteria bacterium]